MIDKPRVAVRLPTLAILVAGFALNLPVQAAKAPYVVRTPFDPKAVAWAAQKGSNTLEGSALLRTVGGEPRTCAALEVNLIPYSQHAAERMIALFRNDERGYFPATRTFRFASTDPAYTASVRTTVCDAQGNFEFRDLPDGRYYVTAFVTWGVPQRYFTRREGGLLMRLISISGGGTTKIVLTA